MILSSALSERVTFVRGLLVLNMVREVLHLPRDALRVDGAAPGLVFLTHRSMYPS